MLPAAALIVSLSLATPEPMASPPTPEPMAPRLSADLDGDGTAEVVTATASRGAVTLRVEGGPARRAITAKAPAPAQDVVRVSHREQLGNCFIAFHFREAAANLLTIDEIDPVGKIPEFKFCAVQVEPLGVRT